MSGPGAAAQWATPRTEGRKSTGGGAAAISALIGRRYMPWQSQVSEVALEVDERGAAVYPLVVVSVPRQAGKTILYGSWMLQRAGAHPMSRVWFTMQTRQDAVDWMTNELGPLLGPLLDAGVLDLRRSAGSEHLRWESSGGMVRPFSPLPDGLHGKLSDLVVVDEAWSFDPLRGRAIDQAIVPTQATRPGAQVAKFSTAGDDASTYWAGICAAGRAAVEQGRRSGLAYFEWSCPDELDVTDPGAWPLFHPAFGFTIGEAHMSAALEQLGAEDFARAYGNRTVHTARRVVGAGVWEAVRVVSQPLPAAGVAAFGFDVDVRRTDAAVVAAWRDAAGVARLEVVDARPAVGWLPERMVELVGRWGPVAVGYDPSGPALDVADVLSRRDVELAPLKGNAYRAACQGLAAAVDAGSVRVAGHPLLDDAAAGAAARTVGDGWVWSRRQAGVSLAPLTAATCALWALDHAPAPVAAFRIF